jgi:sigma-E factor negative regulatory protein RseA
MKEFENASWPERLSALVDGEADAAETAQFAGRWRDDAQVRSAWHGYHLIGDVMRSEELAGRSHDAQFLSALRERLAAEPVVLAPAPVLAPRRRAGLGWRAPAAVAAGFVMVAGALVALRPTEAVDATKHLAVAPVAPSAAVPAAVPAPTPEVVAQSPARGVLIRDARMQQYFDAHQQFGGSTALGLPSAFLRNATYDSPSADAGAR